MIENCKYCEEKLNVKEHLGLSNPSARSLFFKEHLQCEKCNQYSLVYLPNYQIESETLRSGNFYMIYMPVYKTASIVSTEDHDKKIINSFDMNELTHEQAVQWVKKLKTYSIFQ